MSAPKRSHATVSEARTLPFRNKRAARAPFIVACVIWLCVIGGLLAVVGIQDQPGVQAERAKVTKRVIRAEYTNVREARCAVKLWTRESGLHSHAANPTSTAYGVPQMLLSGMKGRKEHRYVHGTTNRSAGEVQVRVGRNYAEARYGSTCRAWSHWQGAGNY